MLILDKEEMYNADRYTIDVLGVADEMLMENAGQAMTNEIKKIVSKSDYISVFIGSGNNGGDGIVVARRLKNLGYNVNLIIASNDSDFKDAAKYHLDLYKKHGYKLLSFEMISNEIEKSDFIIDSLFGIGFKGELKAPYDKIVYQINNSNANIISLDIPSGVSANGEVCKGAIRATYTITVCYPKVSAFLYPAKSHYGKLLVVDAGILPNDEDIKIKRQTWNHDDFKRTLTKRNPNDNKSSAGKALIVGGSKYMMGAPIISAKSCFISGIGLLNLAIPNISRSSAVSIIPEATYVKCYENDSCLYDVDIPEQIDVIACGPGLSREDIVKNLVKKVLLSNVSIVLDADALYFLNDESLIDIIKERKYPTVITPHPGEMARICNCEIKDVESNRFNLSREKSIELNCYIVLKGPHTILTLPDGNQFVNTSGNEGLAKGGSGDILTGIIAAFIPCHSNIQQAISNAIYAHGRAADILIDSSRTNRDLTASCVSDILPKVFKEAYFSKEKL